MQNRSTELLRLPWERKEKLLYIRMHRIYVLTLPTIELYATAFFFLIIIKYLSGLHLICWNFFSLFFLTPEFSYAGRKFERAEGSRSLKIQTGLGAGRRLCCRGAAASLEIFLSFLKQAQLTELQAFIV